MIIKKKKKKKKITISIYCNQKYNRRLFRKVCFCMCPLSFIQPFKIVLITGAMRM